MIVTDSYNPSTTLVLLGIMRDGIDDVYDVGEKLLRVLEVHRERVAPFDGKRMSRQSIVREITSGLPPEKASALLDVIDKITKFIPHEKPESAEKQIDKLKSELERLQEIRILLHMGLDGVVK